MRSSLGSPKYLFLKFFRICVNALARFFCRISSPPKKGQIPPIKEPLLLLPLTKLAQKIRKAEILSETVVKAYVERQQVVNPLVNGLIEDRYKAALEEARMADELVRTSGKTQEELEKEFPLLGIPITVKSNIGLEGMLQEAGLYLRKGTKALADAQVIRNLKDAGAIVLGTTNVPELSASFNTFNKIYGQSWNPHDLSMSSGGSSGGESALISSAASLLGIGNDLCGSLRMPSSVTGIFAHKPSRGLISNDGMYPPLEGNDSLSSAFVVGPMTRYAGDLGSALKVLAGKDHPNLKALGKPVDFKKIKFYYCDDDSLDPMCQPITDKVRQSFRKLLVHLHKKYDVVPKRICLPEIMHSTWILASKNVSKKEVRFSTLMTNHPEKEISLWTEILKCFLGYSNHTWEGLWFALMSKVIPSDGEHPVHEMYRQIEETMSKTCEALLQEDAILLFPSCPVSNIYPFECFTKCLIMHYFLPFNLMGLPVTQCPLGKDNEGYPLSVQVVGGLNQDYLTLAFAEEIEKDFGGWQKPCEVQLEKENSPVENGIKTKVMANVTNGVGNIVSFEPFKTSFDHC